MNETHPSCIHSQTLHNTMSMSNSRSAVSGSSLCTCEECSRYKVPFHHLEQNSDVFDMYLQQQNNTIMSSSSNTSTAHDRTNNSSSSTQANNFTSPPPTTYLARRPSAANMTTSPKLAPGYGGPNTMQPHQRRASFEFHNRERSFQQHSGACDCKGSGVGCGCSFTCDC